MSSPKTEESEIKGFCWKEKCRTEVTLGKETVSELGGFVIEFYVSLDLRVNPDEIDYYRFVLNKMAEVDYEKSIGAWGEATCSSAELANWRDGKLLLKLKEKEISNSLGGHISLFPVEVRRTFLCSLSVCPHLQPFFLLFFLSSFPSC